MANTSLPLTKQSILPLTCIKQVNLKLFAILAMLFYSIPASAHMGHLLPTSGFHAGFCHPFLGLDHLFAMLCVGVTSSRLGGKRLWQIPALFIATMMVGFILGKNGYPFPYFESLIGLSLVFFGIMLVPSVKLYTRYIIAPVIIFALAHGYAHGSEIGILNNPWHFQEGFLVASIIIHIVGVSVGLIPTHKPAVYRAMKACFIGIAIYGIYLL